MQRESMSTGRQRFAVLQVGQFGWPSVSGRQAHLFVKVALKMGEVPRCLDPAPVYLDVLFCSLESFGMVSDSQSQRYLLVLHLSLHLLDYLDVCGVDEP